MSHLDAVQQAQGLPPLRFGAGADLALAEAAGQRHLRVSHGDRRGGEDQQELGQQDPAIGAPAPDIVEAILGGWADQRLMLQQLERLLPVEWTEQRRCSVGQASSVLGL
jgi:hypothetical protein